MKMPLNKSVEYAGSERASPFYFSSCLLKTYPQTVSHPSSTLCPWIKINSAVICSISLDLHYLQSIYDGRCKNQDLAHAKDCADAE